MRVFTMMMWLSHLAYNVGHAKPSISVYLAYRQCQFTARFGLTTSNLEIVNVSESGEKGKPPWGNI